MRVGIVCGFPFPEGLAATVRIITYSKGLVEAGCETDVFLFSPSCKWTPETAKLPVDGSYEGIAYHYPYYRCFFRNKGLRLLAIWSGYYLFSTCRKILEENRKKRFDAILISNDFLRILYVLIPFCRLAGISPFFITDEYPEPIRKYLHEKIPFWKKCLYGIILRATSGMVFMTENLNRFYNSSLRKPFHILPTITDTARFSGVREIPAETPYLCYMGNMELAKDNVDNIIRAFALIAGQYPDLRLLLYGAPSPSNRQVIEKNIAESGLKDRICIMGRAAYEQVPSILKGARVLVTSQPDSKRAEGGFPTKLGEYMSTGVPAVLTDVGEISKYVKDREQVYLVPPENPAAYAKCLKEILDHPEEAREVAERARTLVTEQYDFRPVSKKLKLFLEKVLAEKNVNAK